MNKNFATNRRSVRLPGFDYSTYGYYFVTICTYNRELLFGEIVNGVMKLNGAGIIALDEWNKLSKKYPEIELDKFVIMPNHIHGIIKINGCVGAVHEPPIRVHEPPIRGHEPPIRGHEPPRYYRESINNTGAIHGSVAIHELPLREKQIFMQKRRRMLLPKIVGYFKMNTGKKINLLFNSPGVPVWQRNYYEHIIRDEKDYQNIWEYIECNPDKWSWDENNPKNFQIKKTG